MSHLFHLSHLYIHTIASLLRVLLLLTTTGRATVPRQRFVGAREV